jgi:GDP-L-fucose synthase
MNPIFVTGGNGFLGKHVMYSLDKAGHDAWTYSRHSYDLRVRSDINYVLDETKPKTVIHLAALCGGIGANQRNPATFFYDNLKMGMELIDAAYRFGVEKFVQMGTVCSYPKYTQVPFKEESIWDGYPEETNAPYGIAKKALLVQCQAYRQQYGMNAIYLIPVNLYGPGDNFNESTSHVIPALIKKCIEAKRTNAPNIEVWGTGNAYREFLYVEDCAEAIVAATEKYNGAEPINIGTGEEVPICNLVCMIKAATGYEGATVWSSDKPDGQPRRRLDTTKAVDAFGFKAKTSLVDGLRKTVDWYVKTFDLYK